MSETEIERLQARARDDDDYIDQLNVLCEDFGCDAGTNRLTWLHERLTEIEHLQETIKELREALEYLSDPSRYDATVTNFARAALLNERQKA